MDEHAPRKRGTRFTRAARAARILEQARDGFAYDDIARKEKITVTRVHEIVAEEITRREADANLQLDRLGHAMPVAREALAQAHVKAIAPFVKVFDRLDRCQALFSRGAEPRRRRRDAGKAVMKELAARVGRADESPASPTGRPAEAPPAPAPAAPPAADPTPVVTAQLDPPAAPAAAEPPPAPAASPRRPFFLLDPIRKALKTLDPGAEILVSWRK